MRRLSLAITALAVWTAPAAAQTPPLPKPALMRCAGEPSKPPPAREPRDGDKEPLKPLGFVPEQVWTEGSVTAGGQTIPYCAVAGTLVVHPKGWDDAAGAAGKDDDDDARKALPAQAAMFYVAYLRRDAGAAPRPVTFLFNGGPGSSTVWLHMGAFGPRRVETEDAAHGPAAPYRLVDNADTLLDVSDLVFIDAPGTGFSRILGTNKEDAFYGVDPDAYAFSRFIEAFLTRFERWNAPKFLLGESYGTTRAAVLAALLQSDPGVDLNGVVLLSPTLADTSYPDTPEATPGNDLPYVLALPTYAATAWYHAQPPGSRPVGPPLALMTAVERFAMGEYAAALAAGSLIDAARRDAIVTQLHQYTSLPPEYLRRAGLRVGPDQFRQELLHERGQIAGAADTRYVGDTLDRLDKRAGYDPSDAAVTSAYVSTFNDYARRVLRYGEGRSYRADTNTIIDRWRFAHTPPDSANTASGSGPVNVLPDLAQAMKFNPLLKVQVNAGYFDLVTPWLQGVFEMAHLPIPANLRANVEYRCYQSGHMVYLRPTARALLHTAVAGFIARAAAPPIRDPRGTASGIVGDAAAGTASGAASGTASGAASGAAGGPASGTASGTDCPVP